MRQAEVGWSGSSGSPCSLSLTSLSGLLLFKLGFSELANASTDEADGEGINLK